MINISSRIVSVSSIFFRIKKSEMFSVIVERNACFPFFTKTPKRYPFVLGSFPPRFFVSRILKWSTFTNIFSPIVKCVSVFMVSLFSFFTTKNQSVHGLCMPFSINPNIRFRIKMGFAMVNVCVPVEFHEPIEILSINNGILSPRKRDVAVRYVERLDNCMASQGTFCRHFRTSSTMMTAAILA